MQKLPEIKRIILSCETSKQLDTCKEWVDYIYPNACQSKFIAYSYIEQMKRKIQRFPAPDEDRNHLCEYAVGYPQK